MTLKTLKDFDWLDKASGDYGNACSVNEDEIKKELKQEAIKHIKALRDGKITNKSGMRLRNIELGIIDWIKYFFKTKPPKNLKVFLEEFIRLNQKEKIISHIDLNTYILKREDKETIKLNLTNRNYVEKICFIPTENINIMFKEV